MVPFCLNIAITIFRNAVTVADIVMKCCHVHFFLPFLWCFQVVTVHSSSCDLMKSWTRMRRSHLTRTYHHNSLSLSHTQARVRYDEIMKCNVAFRSYDFWLFAYPIHAIRCMCVLLCGYGSYDEPGSKLNTNTITHCQCQQLLLLVYTLYANRQKKYDIYLVYHIKVYYIWM